MPTTLPAAAGEQAAHPSYAAVAAAAAPADPKPSTPSRKKVSLLLSESPATSSPSDSPYANRFADDGAVPDSPRTAARKQHEYTSLAALRKANKGKTVDRGDRTNGWHLWNDAGGEHAEPEAGERAGAGRALKKEDPGRAVKKKLSTLDMVRPPRRPPLGVVRRACVVRRSSPAASQQQQLPCALGEAQLPIQVP